MKKFYFLFLAQLLAVTSFSQTELWGMTLSGGQGYGVIFKTDGNGNNMQTMYDFTPNISGREPMYTKPCFANNGKVYGVTSVSAQSAGSIYEYNPGANTYKALYYFAYNGTTPYGGLIQASNNKLYGMCHDGGLNSKGVIYEYDIATSTFQNLIDFNGVGNGSKPYGSLLQASDGNLYGMTAYGGTSDSGVIFKYDISANTITKLHDFSGTNGQMPFGNLFQASNGKLYGMTGYGGTNTWGVIFQYDLGTSTYTKLMDLNGAATGGNPHGGFVQAPSGKLYGVTLVGGANAGGTLFEYNISTSTFTKKIDLNTNSGYNSWGDLLQASNGRLYGLTSSGGTSGVGTIFEYEIATNILTKKNDFDGLNIGDNANGALTEIPGGKIICTPAQGGKEDQGCMYWYDLNTSTGVKKFDFNAAPMGRYPEGSLLLASNNKLYGMTSDGGVNTWGGVLFEYDRATLTYTVKYDFSAGPAVDGFKPKGSLIEAPNGKLYGLATSGGVATYGVLFEYDPATNIYTKKIDFLGNSNGNVPNGSLMMAANGKMYGMTQAGGSNNMGVIFEYDYLTNTLIKKKDFSGPANGSYPLNDLIQASNGKLYGMTHDGGVQTYGGTIFEYDYTTNTLTKKVDFVGATNGRNPCGSLAQALNGKLYGMTEIGGAISQGVFFEYDISANIYTKILDCDLTTGTQSHATLLQASNGKLYGLSRFGGAYYNGLLFEYDPSTTTYTDKFDFNILTGATGSACRLIEIPASLTGLGVNISCENHLNVYPDPSNGKFMVEGKGELNIYNVMGEKTFSEKLIENKNEIDLSERPKGIYFVQLTSAAGVAVKKMIIE